MRHVSRHGVPKGDRTGTGTKSVFGHQMRFDLSEGFPLVTTKKVHFKSIALELLWFLRGDGTSRWLQEHGVTIWDEWADAGRRPRPGLRRAVAQLADARRRPHRPDRRGRRLLDDEPRLAPDHRQRLERRATSRGWRWRPCHAFFQFYVRRGGERLLSCQLYQRSADIFLGVPFNIASYALLTHMLAQQCDLDVGDFVWTGGDCHIYGNHASRSRRSLVAATRSRTRRCDCCAGRRRSSTTRTRTSRSSATSTIRRSRRRSPCDGLARRRGRPRRRDRPGRGHPVAHPGGHGALQGAHDGTPGRDGAAHLGVASGPVPAAAGPPQRRRHPECPTGAQRAPSAPARSGGARAPRVRVAASS